MGDSGGCCTGGGGGLTIPVPLILDAPLVTDPVLELGIGHGQVGTEAVQRLVWNADGSARWSDGTNPAAIQLVLDDFNGTRATLGLYGIGSLDPSLNLWSHQMAPDGTVTGGPAQEAFVAPDQIGVFNYGNATGGRAEASLNLVGGYTFSQYGQFKARRDSGAAASNFAYEVLSDVAPVDPLKPVIGLTYDGHIKLGPGNAVPDVDISRVAAGVLGVPLLQNTVAGNETASATAGAGAAVPATVSGFLSFRDHTGTVKKLAYFDA